MSYDPTNERPYHETVVGLITIITVPVMAAKVAVFIVATACPANHDAIIAAWRDLLEHLKMPDDSAFGVIAALEAKKTAAEAKAAGERLRSNFDVGFTDKKS